MTGWNLLLVVAAVSVVNPLRLASTLTAPTPLGVESTSIRRALSVPVIALGVAGVVVVFGVVALASDWLLDAIDVSPPTMRIAAGLTLVAGAIRDVLSGRPTADPALPGWKAAVVPVALPFVARPELAVLVVSIATIEGLGVAMAALVAMGIAVVAVGAVDRAPTGVYRRVLDTAGWALSLGCLVLGIALAVDGVYGV